MFLKELVQENDNLMVEEVEQEEPEIVMAREGLLKILEDIEVPEHLDSIEGALDVSIHPRKKRQEIEWVRIKAM